MTNMINPVAVKTSLNSPGAFIRELWEIMERVEIAKVVIAVIQMVRKVFMVSFI